MSDQGCPICEDPGKCRGYPALWARLRRPDGHRWRALHDRLNPQPRPYPSVATMAGNAVKAMATAVASGFKTVDKAEQERRLAICHECPDFDAKRNRCRRCSCKMPWKTRLEAFHCPIDKW